jgi:myosin heavy subunit
VATLLKLDAQALRFALVHQANSIGPRKERIVVPLTRAQAGAGRDALAQRLYSRLFSWLVTCLNDVIESSVIDNDDHSLLRINLLHIFGFEIVEHNSFEQLCIN